MNGSKSKKRDDLQKSFPRSAGGMINVFDLSTGMGGSRQLTDKAHRDGSPSRRNRPEVVKKPLDHVVVYADDKQLTSEMRKSSSGKRSGGTPMKMLIAQEMSKEVECKRKQPNVVARLMGLDEALPDHQPVPSSEGKFERSGRSSSRVTLAGALQNCRQREDGYFDRSIPWEVRSGAHENEYRDVYELWQQPPSRTSHCKDYPLQKGRYGDSQNERRMALVRQKFMEAKRLATDERLLQSREFQDALEVLSSNTDLFLKFLEEPNSLFSKHLKELHSNPVAPQPNRITVLKPSRTLEMKGDAQVKKHSNEGAWGMDRPRRSSSTTQPTRIVVLKPSPGKRHDTKPMVMPHISSPELMESDDLDHHLFETTESIGSREAAKDITQQIRESVCSIRRDESLLSSIISNGYVGDESSFSKSENQYGGEDDGNFSDSDIPSPTARHSWDYSNRFGSPYSQSSFSRASCSPEPSVIREAKKRLSERWFLVANGNSQEQVEVRRSSSTLGEMLAIPEVKKEAASVGGLTVPSSRSNVGEEDLRVSHASSSACQTKDGDVVEISPVILSRSRSLPVSCASEKIGLNSEVSNTRSQKPVVVKDTAKSKSGKSSFKGKVSSLFFSRNKKSGKEGSVSSSFVVGSKDVGKGGGIAEPVGKVNDDHSHPSYNSQPEAFPLVNPEEKSINESYPASVKGSAKQGTIPFRAVLSIDKTSTTGSLSDKQDNPSLLNKIGENQNQPSPTSVLDATFEDVATNTTPNSSEIQNAGRSLAPIESVARTLSWDDTNLEESSPDSSNLARTFHETNAEEQQRHSFVWSILSASGLHENSIFVRWHSVDCPLDPALLDKFVDRKEEDAKSRERRSNQRLLFDCVNSALLEIGKTAYWSASPWARAFGVSRKKAISSAFIGDEVWVIVSDWFSGERESESGEIDNFNIAVDTLLRREVGGNGWAESMHSEIDELGRDISGQVFEELVKEVLADLTVECFI